MSLEDQLKMPTSSKNAKKSAKLYITNLGPASNEKYNQAMIKRDLEVMLSKYGKLKEVCQNNPKAKPPYTVVMPSKNKANFAYVEFDDILHAEQAIMSMNGAVFNGRKLGVEYQYEESITSLKDKLNDNAPEATNKSGIEPSTERDSHVHLRYFVRYQLTYHYY